MLLPLLVLAWVILFAPTPALPAPSANCAVWHPFYNLSMSWDSRHGPEASTQARAICDVEKPQVATSNPISRRP